MLKMAVYSALSWGVRGLNGISSSPAHIAGSTRIKPANLSERQIVLTRSISWAPMIGSISSVCYNKMDIGERQ